MAGNGAEGFSAKSDNEPTDDPAERDHSGRSSFDSLLRRAAHAPVAQPAQWAARLQPGTLLASGRLSIVRRLGEGGMGVVYAAWDSRAERHVAVKTFQELSGDAVYRIKNEFRSLADIQHPNLVRLDELHCDAGRWFFTMELVEGESFRDYVSGPDLAHAPTMRKEHTGSGAADMAAIGRSEARLRAVTRQLVAGLLHLHELGRVHCDVKPSNVLVTSEGHLVLLDFGLARLWSGDSMTSATQGKIEGTIAYMAPEQAAGERPTPATDLYAVGAMLYEILAGRLPFTGSAVQILAGKQRDEAPHDLPPRVPKDLAALALALLRRRPIERPSGAEVIDRLGATSHVTIAPATTVSEAPQEIFVGRTAELARLRTQLDRSRGELGPVVIRGQAGVGKSALVRHFAAEARRHDGALVFASRCHEREAVPLKALDGIVDDLSHHLISLGDVDAALVIPPDIVALVQAFPALGRVPVVQRATGAVSGVALSPEQRDRAAVALAQMLRGLSRSRPVILVIDDLQWADDASWPFLAKVTGAEQLPVLLLATARATDDATRDPLRPLLEAGAPWFDRCEQLLLDGLTSEDAVELLRTAAPSALDPGRARELAAESKGHPLFLKELGRLVAGSHAGDRPVSLISALEARISTLATRERDVLETVCLTGSAIDLAAVAHSLHLSLTEGSSAAQRLKGSQLLRIDVRDGARVAEPYHDRVREVVEARLEREPERRFERHEAIGLSLLHAAGGDPRGTALFAIVNNLNRAADRRTTQEAKAELARLNAQAATRAAEAAAHAQALAYVERGLHLLGETLWEAQRGLAFELLTTRMQCEYLSGAHEPARRTFRELASRATTPAEIGDIYSLKAELEGNADADAESVAAVREGLGRLGFAVPKKPSLLRVIAALLWTRWVLRRWSAADIAALPATTDERNLAGSRITKAGSVAMHHSDNNLLVVMTLQWLRRSLAQGLSLVTPSAMSFYGVIQAASLQLELAAEFGRAGMEIEERVGVRRSLVPRITCTFWVLPWTRPYRECIEMARQALAGHRRIDEPLWMNIGYCGISCVTSWLGSSVEEFARAAEIARRDAERMNWGDHAVAMSGEARWASLIADRAAREDPCSAFSAPIEPRFQFAAFAASVRRVFAEFHFGSRARAHAASHALVREDTMGFGQVLRVVTTLYRALAARALLQDAGWFGRWRLRRDIATGRTLLRRAAQACPENFSARQLLLEADVSRLGEAPDEVDRRFASAIEVATRYGDLQPLALAHELWAEALLERRDARAPEQVELACATWERYGAHRIAARVRERLRGQS